MPRKANNTIVGNIAIDRVITTKRYDYSLQFHSILSRYLPLSSSPWYIVGIAAQSLYIVGASSWQENYDLVKIMTHLKSSSQRPADKLNDWIEIRKRFVGTCTIHADKMCLIQIHPENNLCYKILQKNNMQKYIHLCYLCLNPYFSKFIPILTLSRKLY